MKSFKRKFENILKRSLALMLVLCMFLGCLAYAEEEDPDDQDGTGTTQETPASGDTKPSGGDTVVTSDGTATGRIRVFIQAAKGKQEGTSSEVKLSEGEWRILGVYASNFYTPFLTNLTGENSIKENAEQALKALGSFDETQAANWAGSIAGLATEPKNLNELKLYIRKKESEDSYKFKEIKGVPVNYYNYIHMMLGTITDLMISYNDFSLLTETPGEAYKECKDYKDKIPDLTDLSMNIGVEKLDSFQLENFSNAYSSISDSVSFPMYPNTFLGENSIDYTGIIGYYQYLARRIGVTVPKTYYKKDDHYYSVSEYGVEPVDEGTDLDKLDTKISEDLLYYAELANTTDGNGMAYLGISDSKICSNFYVNPQDKITGTVEAEVKLSASQKVFLKCLELSDLNSGYGLSIFNIKKDEEGESLDLIEKLSENKLKIDESKVQGTIFGTKMACSCFGDIVIMSDSENIVAIPACMNPFIWQPVDDKGKDIQGYAGGDGNYSSGEKKKNIEGLGSYVNIINIPLISEYESKDLFSSNSFSTSGKLSQGSFSFSKTKEALGTLDTNDTNEATQGSTQAYYDLRIAHGSGGEGDNDKAANVAPYSPFLLASSLYSAGAYKTESLDRQNNATLVSLWANASEMGNIGLVQSWGGAFDAVTLLNNDLNDRTSRHVDGLILSTDETLSTASKYSLLSRVCVIHPKDFKNVDNRYFLANAAYLDTKAEAYFYESGTLDSDNYKLVTFIPFVSSEDYKETKYSPKKENIGGYTSSFKDIVKDDSKSQVDRYKEYVKDTKGTTALMIYLTYLYAGYCGGCVEGYKEEQPDRTIGELGYRLNFDNVSSMEDFNKDAAGEPVSDPDDSKDQKDGMLDAIKGWLYYLLNPKEGLTYIRVWFTNKVGTIICSIHNAMLGTHGVGQTLGVTRYRSTTGFITMPDLSEMEWSSTLMDVLYSAIPYLIIAALILFVLMFATATLPFQKCILGFIIFCVVVCLPIPVTNTVVGWTNRTLSNMYGEKFTYWAMIQQESYLEDIDKAAQGEDYENYLRTIYEKNSDTNPNQGSECVQVKWQAPKKMQSLMYTSADSKTTKNLFQNSLFTKALQNNYSGERFEDNDTAVYLYRSYLDIANASRYIYRGLFGTDGAFTKRTRALKPLATLLSDNSLSHLNRDEDKSYRDSLNTMLDDTNAYIDKGYMNKSMRSEVSDDPAYQIRHIYAPLSSKIVTDQLTQRGTIPYIVDAEETLGLHQDFFGFSIAMFNIKGKNVSETQESESETNAETPTSESEKQTESESEKDSEEFVAKTKEDWLSTAETVKKLFAETAIAKNKGYSNSHNKKSFLKFTFTKEGYKDKKISARRDCSGYVNAALYAAGILPKSALKNGGKLSTKLNLSKYGFEKIEVKSGTKLKKGDILVRKNPGHIEIYAGGNKVWSAGNTNQVKNTGKNSKMHTDYLWRKTWEKAEDEKKDTDGDGEDPDGNSTPASETPSTEAPSTRTFYSQLLESAKDPEGFATYCENEGYSEPDDANGDPDKEGLHPNELEYSGLATYGIYSESVFYYFSWLLYDYGLNPESSEVDHFKELLLKDTSNGSIDFFYNNTGEYGNGELKDFMDMRGLFTYVIPYLKRLNDIVVEWDDYYGLKYYKGIATGENLFNQYTADKSQKYWNNLNTARLYNIYTPWVDLMYDCSYAKSEDIKFLGKTYTVKDPLDPNSYPAAEGRPMIFSQSEMSGMGLTKKDLTAVEKLILKCNEGMQGRMFEILNYANFNDVTLNTIAAMECAFQFNKTFSEENFIRKSGNNIIYPQGFELSDFSYDAYLRYVLSESTGESLVGLKDADTDTDDFYFRVMKKSSLITGLMYLIVDIVSMYLLPWSKIIFIVLTLLAGMFVILVSLFRLDKQHNFLKKFWDAFLLPIIGFTVVTMAMGLVLSLFMGMANNVITQTNTATIRFGDPVTAMAAILVVELAVFYCYTRFISKQFATVKSNGSVLVNTLTGVVGGIGVAVSGAFKNLTNGNSSKGKVTASESSTSGTSSANERAINRSKIQVEDKDDRSRRRRSRAEERAERHKEDIARRNNNLNQGIETKEEYNKRKEEERRKTEELNRKTEQGADHVQGTESNQN